MNPKQESKKAILAGIRIGIVILLIFMSAGSSYYSVSEQQNAVVTMFGELVRTDTAGPHFKFPFIQKVRKVDMTTHGIGIGYAVAANGQNIVVPEDGVMITSDFNLLNIDFYLEYKVSDPVAYLFNTLDPEDILTNITLASIRTTVVNYTVDEAMTTGKSQIQAEIKSLIAQELEEHNIGMQVVNITIQDSEPPTQEIIAAFKAVETAKQSADTAKNQALQYQNERIPAAEAEADKIVQDAEAYKSARIAEAEGQVARFNAMYEQYELNPLITKKRMFYETIEEVLPDLKVIITDGGTQTLYPIEQFSSFTTDTTAREVQ
ncbi:MAG: FtsH protease activity modulator HflK [Lachnospiraceae bacterium]|nr:FtsH protease activity modulator HflK [Lachnospiraceae bacterium]